MFEPEKIICDICGEEITRELKPFGYYHVRYLGSEGTLALPVIRVKEKVDICKDCWSDMKDYLTALKDVRKDKGNERLG